MLPASTRFTVLRAPRRGLIVIAALFVAALGQTARAADAFPYVAYVTQDETYVRSGPGGDFYPTGQLNPPVTPSRSTGMTATVGGDSPGGRKLLPRPRPSTPRPRTAARPG